MRLPLSSPPRSGTAAQPARRASLFYGWYVVAVLAVSLAVSSGARYTFGVVLKPVTEEFGWDRAVFAGAAATSMLLSGGLGPGVGWLVDRWGSRRTLIASFILGSLTMLGMSFVTELWQAYLVYGVLSGIVFSTTSSVVTAPITTAWFFRQRGTAMAIAASGLSIGQLLVVPVVTYLLVAFSWRDSYRFLAALMLLVLLPLQVWLLRDRPSDLGLTPDGDPAAGENAARARAEGARRSSLRQAFRDVTFWRLAFGLFACGFTMSFAQVHFMAFASDMHALEMSAAGALGMAGVFSLIGGYLAGWLSDRVGRHLPLSVAYFLRGLSYLVLLVAPGEPALFVFGVILGLSWTATVPLASAMTADTFGGGSLGSIFGFIFMGMLFGGAVGAYLDGFIYDLQHSYEVAIAINVAVAFAAGLVSLRLAESRKTG